MTCLWLPHYKGQVSGPLSFDPRVSGGLCFVISEENWGGGLHGVATWTETSALCIVAGPASDVDGGLALCIR